MIHEGLELPVRGRLLQGRLVYRFLLISDGL